MSSWFDVTGKTRGEAVAAFRAIPLPDRRKLLAAHAGISWRDYQGVIHVMRWPVVEEEGGLKRALSTTTQENP